MTKLTTSCYASILWSIPPKIWEFGLRKGLADSKKIDMPEHAHGKRGHGTQPDTCGRDARAPKVHRCLVLDPAAGTGTFLYEVIEQIQGGAKEVVDAVGQFTSRLGS